jgi:hypothetical protein
MAKTSNRLDTERVMRELSRADRLLARVIRRIGRFPTKKRKPQHPFASLLQTIVYQQLAGKAAGAIFGRVKALGANGVPTPEEILQASTLKLRRAGLSRQKIAAVRDLAAKTLDGTVPALAKIRRMSEQENPRTPYASARDRGMVRTDVSDVPARPSRRAADSRLRNSQRFPARLRTQGRPQTQIHSRTRGAVAPVPLDCMLVPVACPGRKADEAEAQCEG